MTSRGVFPLEGEVLGGAWSLGASWDKALWRYPTALSFTCCLGVWTPPSQGAVRCLEVVAALELCCRAWCSSLYLFRQGQVPWRCCVCMSQPASTGWDTLIGARSRSLSQQRRAAAAQLLTSKSLCLVFLSLPPQLGHPPVLWLLRVPGWERQLRGGSPSRRNRYRQCPIALRRRRLGDE